MLTYSDCRRPGGRYPRLYFIKGLEYRKFAGASIPGWCTILREDYKKAGKWSGTTYEILLHPGVIAWILLPDLHKEWGWQYRTWGELCEGESVPLQIAKEVISKEYPHVADRLNYIDQVISELEVGDDVDADIYEFSFGAPAKKAWRNGYWDSPKSFYINDLEIEVTPVKDEDGRRDYIATKPEGAKVVGWRTSPGIHGGYVHIQIAVPRRR